MITQDFHVHLHGCLTATQLWSIGRDVYKERIYMLDWYASEYEKAWGFKPDYKKYWESDNGLEKLQKDYVFSDKNNFSRFQANFNLIIALCNITPHEFLIQEQIIRNVSNYGLKYFEARTLIPFRFNSSDSKKYLEGLCKLIGKLNEELLMKTKLVFSLFRDEKISLEHYSWIREFIELNPKLGKEIVGIDFAYAEEGFPPKNKVMQFNQFKKDNRSKKPLKLLYHVGESFEDKGIGSAIRWIFESHKMGADRLGHALALGLDPNNFKGQIVFETMSERFDTINWLIDNRSLLADHGYIAYKELEKEKENLPEIIKIEYDNEYIEDMQNLQKAVCSILANENCVIECCPTSNFRIGQIKDIEFHPLKFFKKQGINTVIGTDDPGVFAIDWESESKFIETIQCYS